MRVRQATSNPGIILAELTVSTEAGLFRVRYSVAGLSEVEFPKEENDAQLPAAATPSVAEPVKSWHEKTARALHDILAGREAKDFPPFDLSIGTEFQKRVWHVLRKIEMGQTRSYAEVAEMIGNPKAVRAVGGACGANPIPVLIPCHRVLAARHKLGGFSGGLNWKRILLEREGVLFSSDRLSETPEFNWRADDR